MTEAVAKLPPAFRRRVWPRVFGVLLVAYVIYASAQMGISWERAAVGFDDAQRLFSRLFPPNFARSDLLVLGLIESLQIAVLASFLGIVLALPIGFAAARNLMPGWVSWPARAFIVVARVFHPVIVAILLVKAVGFGALAGIVALIVASIGFVGRQLAEAIEEISQKQVVAVRATGSPLASVISYGVWPQVLARFIGGATCQLDANLRNSTMVGIVGAGGIGGTLFAAFQRADYDFVCAIVIAIIALIMVGEVIAMAVRAVFADNRTPFDLFRAPSPRVRGKGWGEGTH